MKEPAPCEYIRYIWTKKPDRFTLDSVHQAPGSNDEAGWRDGHVMSAHSSGRCRQARKADRVTLENDSNLYDQPVQISMIALAQSRLNARRFLWARIGGAERGSAWAARSVSRNASQSRFGKELRC
ncbi:MAG: hypothetical protein CVT83_04270 [Alphaproteobacteria bacterium HGW-Alphaproteobacteria-5]|nr:MAG: hypothetical protein CVT83_04270 [Alphaproteobacteria bacterium HGW-Alphaproteobacteria-5]